MNVGDDWCSLDSVTCIGLVNVRPDLFNGLEQVASEGSKLSGCLAMASKSPSLSSSSRCSAMGPVTSKGAAAVDAALISSMASFSIRSCLKSSLS